MAYNELNEFDRKQLLEQFNGENNFSTVPLSAFKEGLEIAKKLKPKSDKWLARITPVLNQIQANRLAGKDTQIDFGYKTIIFHADGSVTNHKENFE